MSLNLRNLFQKGLKVRFRTKERLQPSCINFSVDSNLAWDIWAPTRWQRYKKRRNSFASAVKAYVSPMFMTSALRRKRPTIDSSSLSEQREKGERGNASGNGCSGWVRGFGFWVPVDPAHRPTS